MASRSSEDSLRRLSMQSLPPYESLTEKLEESSMFVHAKWATGTDLGIPSWLKKLFYLVVNVVASVGIIFYNRYALNDPQLSAMPVTIVAVHSFCTAGVMFLASRPSIAFFQPANTPYRSMLSLSMAFPLYVILGLLSVHNNPVAIYQLGKVMNTPVLILINYLFFSTRVSRLTIWAIILMCSGVSATIHGRWDETNIAGLCYASLSTIAASFFQIGVGRKHKQLGLSSPQLIYQQSQLSGLLLLPVIPLFDTMVSPANLSFSAFAGLLGTGIVASLVNLSQFLVIESTSALTFNVASQLKTCLVLIIAWLIAEKPPSVVDYAGVAVTIIGSSWYAGIALSERSKKVVVNEKSELDAEEP